MEKLEQLVQVINQMKEAKRNGAEVNNQQEMFYTIALLKEVFGDELNAGVLREMMKDVRGYLFDTSMSISIGEQRQSGKFGISFQGTTRKGQIVANIDEDGNLYRGDVSLFEESKHEWRPNNNCSYQFSNGICTKNTPGQKTEMSFDVDGLEMSRQIIKYDNVAKTERDIISMTTIERSPAAFNVVHVNTNERGANARSFEAQITGKLYSLANAEQGHTFAMSDDATDLAYDSVGDELAYKYFPELEEVITARLQNTTKAR